MIIIHTADWHIGQTFHDYERYKEHEHFFEWMENKIEEEKADCLIIAGDVFDGPNPSAYSQHIYYDFLRRITNRNPDLQIVIIAGNHDSAARLEAPNPLLEIMNIKAVGMLHREKNGEIDYTPALIKIKGKTGQDEAICAAVPYLRQGDYPAGVSSYAQGVQILYQQIGEIAKECGLPIVMTGHIQLLGAAITEDDRSERSVIGGLDCVPPSVFPDYIAYGALGHLHRAQRVGGRENIRYSGAPIPMSFAEKNNVHGVVKIEIKEAATAISTLEYTPLAGLISIPGKDCSFERVIEAIKALPEGEVGIGSPYIEIKILMTEPNPSYKRTIEEALKGKAVRLARIESLYKKAEERGSLEGKYTELQQIKPIDIARQVFTKKYGNEMPKEMEKLMSTVIEEVQR